MKSSFFAGRVRSSVQIGIGLLVSSLLSGCGGIIGTPLGAAEATVDLCSTRWVLTQSAVRPSTCAVQVTGPVSYEAGKAAWPDLVYTSDLKLSFTVTTQNASSPAADGFAIALGDPSAGATPTTVGGNGGGFGARGIPGVVFAINSFQNPGDPATPYLGITRGETDLFSNPWLYTSKQLDPVVVPGATTSHDYVYTFTADSVTVTMDGKQIFQSSDLAVPSVAYVYLSGGTGLYYEQATFSNLKMVYGVVPTS